MAGGSQHFYQMEGTIPPLFIKVYWVNIVVMKTKKIFPTIILSWLCLSLTLITCLSTDALGEKKRSNIDSYHKVKFVYDGDTVLLNSGEKVRYLGINTPEIDHQEGKHEFMALDARRFNKKIVKGTQIRLEYDTKKRDRYGRLLAYVFLKNEKMVNELLIRKGLAHVLLYRKNLKYKDILLDSQRKAMKAKRGIWSKAIKRKEKIYLGNKNSFRFHDLKCPFGKKISKKNLVKIKTRHDAFWNGFSPCKHCRP